MVCAENTQLTTLVNPTNTSSIWTYRPYLYIPNSTTTIVTDKNDHAKCLSCCYMCRDASHTVATAGGESGAFFFFCCCSSPSLLRFGLEFLVSSLADWITAGLGERATGTNDRSTGILLTASCIRLLAWLSTWCSTCTSCSDSAVLSVTA